jgi:3-oxoacyl-[acyl-carrier-protein] synthase I
MKKRVVITGMGVVSPNATGTEDFREALIQGKSGIQYYAELAEADFRCQLAGKPKITDEAAEQFIKKHALTKLRSTGILYGCMAALEAWHDAGLEPVDKKSEAPDWDSGCIFGTGISGVEATLFGIRMMDAKDIRKLGGRSAQQGMNSGVSAYIGGLLGLGNQVTTNASACSTGTEAVLEAYWKIKSGMVQRIIAGSTESNSPYIWAPFDSMQALAKDFNEQPEKASCPMSKHATGFVPAAGAGALVLEGLDTALLRNAKIYAEVLGGNINSGGQRGSGSMTMGNPEGVVRCITNALLASGIDAGNVDLISGHLTATGGDPNEVRSWAKALNRYGTQFPKINSVKSMIGHCLSGSGSVEIVACALQLYHQFIHPSLNTEELHPDIEQIIDKSCIPQTAVMDAGINIAAKISLGFGDVNACLILKKWN